MDDPTKSRVRAEKSRDSPEKVKSKEDRAQKSKQKANGEAGCKGVERRLSAVDGTGKGRREVTEGHTCCQKPVQSSPTHLLERKKLPS